MQQENFMKIIINKESKEVIDIELDDEALVLNSDEFLEFVEDAILRLQSLALSLNYSV